MASPQQSSFRFVITRDAAFVNDQPLRGAAPPSDLYRVLGAPDRVLDGSRVPAPVGYRNNRFHYYDRHGITLNEHHYTYQVQALNLVFNTSLSDHPTLNAFSGTLLLAGVLITAGSLERALAESSITFTSRLPGMWFTTIGESGISPITIAVTTQGPKLKSGRRSKTKIITGVSLCLTHDRWDTTHRPQ